MPDPGPNHDPNPHLNPQISPSPQNPRPPSSSPVASLLGPLSAGRREQLQRRDRAGVATGLEECVNRRDQRAAATSRPGRAQDHSRRRAAARGGDQGAERPSVRPSLRTSIVRLRTVHGWLRTPLYNSRRTFQRAHSFPTHHFPLLLPPPPLPSDFFSTYQVPPHSHLMHTVLHLLSDSAPSPGQAQGTGVRY